MGSPRFGLCQTLDLTGLPVQGCQIWPGFGVPEVDLNGIPYGLKSPVKDHSGIHRLESGLLDLNLQACNAHISQITRATTLHFGLDQLPSATRSLKSGVSRYGSWRLLVLPPPSCACALAPLNHMHAVHLVMSHCNLAG